MKKWLVNNNEQLIYNQMVKNVQCYYYYTSNSYQTHNKMLPPIFNKILLTIFYSMKKMDINSSLDKKE